MQIGPFGTKLSICFLIFHFSMLYITYCFFFRSKARSSLSQHRNHKANWRMTHGCSVTDLRINCTVDDNKLRTLNIICPILECLCLYVTLIHALMSTSEGHFPSQQLTAAQTAQRQKLWPGYCFLTLLAWVMWRLVLCLQLGGWTPHRLTRSILIYLVLGMTL